MQLIRRLKYIWQVTVGGIVIEDLSIEQRYTVGH